MDKKTKLNLSTAPSRTEDNCNINENFKFRDSNFDHVLYDFYPR
uniref:Uncharacterized protein n=1 Tax=Ciona intestinalis TaxID=7719 RepID=H2XMQ6_CIOIN